MRQPDAYQVILADRGRSDGSGEGVLPVLRRPCGGWSAAARAADEDGELVSDCSDQQNGDQLSNRSDGVEYALAAALASNLTVIESLNPPTSPRTLRADTLRAEATEALLLRDFLSEDEVLSLISLAESMGADEFCGESDVSVFGHDVCFSADHVALNLHRDDYMARTLPGLTAKILAGMRFHPDHWVDPAVDLNVRCVEFHTCARRAHAHAHACTHACTSQHKHIHMRHACAYASYRPWRKHEPALGVARAVARCADVI